MSDSSPTPVVPQTAIDIDRILAHQPTSRSASVHSPADYRQLLSIADALPVLISFVDADLRYAFVNAAYERWFGRPKELVLGRTLEQILGADAYASIEPYTARALRGETVVYQTEIPYQSGGHRYVEATYVPQYAEGTGQVTGFVALVSDITERRNLERFRSDAATRANRLLKITAAIADAVTPPEVFAALVDQVSEAVGAATVGLWLVDHHGKRAALVRSRGYQNNADAQFGQVDLAAEPSIPAIDCIRWQAPIWMASQQDLVRRYPHLHSVVTFGRSYRLSCLPLATKDRCVGSLCITLEDGRGSDQDERDFLLLIARYATQAIERVRLLEAEQASRTVAEETAAHMSTLSRASRAFVDCELSTEPRMRHVVAELSHTLNAATAISLVQSDGRLTPVAIYHPNPDVLAFLRELTERFPARVGHGVTGTVAATGQSVLITPNEMHGLLAQVDPRDRPLVERHALGGMACAPLSRGGRVIGTVTAVRIGEGAPFAPAEVKLLDELGDRVAIAVENSRLYQETVDARRRAEELFRFAHAVVNVKAVEEIFDAALNSIERGLGVRRSAILTFDNNNVLRFRAWRELSATYRRAVEGHSPWKPDDTAPEAVLVEDVLNETSLATYATLFRTEGIGALAFIPLVTRGRLLGKLMVYHDEPHGFVPQEVGLAQAIANHLASVMIRLDATERLEETVRCNEMFAGVLAHDLRSPLTAIMNAARLVLECGASSTSLALSELEPLERVVEGGKRMARMIEQLLDFTRARSGGGIGVTPREIDLGELCSQAVHELALAHPDWTVQTDFVGELKALCDPDRLLQVVSNLVVNAGQHGDAGAPIVLRVDGSSPNEVRLEVHNRGSIPEALQPRLFDPFRNAHHHDRRRSQGLGLGLYIVRTIVEAHDGYVEFDSAPATGTRVVVVLPRSTARPLSAASPSATRGSS